MQDARTVSVSIDRSPAEVYDYATDPRHLPDWSFFESVAPAGDDWVAAVPGGAEVRLRFVPRNELGVLDHTVELGPGDLVSMTMRVVANEAGSEVLFTAFRRPGATDADFDADVAAVATDLATLKRRLEA